jgi:hypothetical protein
MLRTIRMAAGLALCAAAGVLTGTAWAASPALDPANGFVMHPAMSANVLAQCGRPYPHDIEALWDPSPAEISELETRLPPALAGKRDEMFHPPRESYRQYVGFVAHGHQYIYVDAFPLDGVHQVPGDRPPDWSRELLNVCGGGADFFGIVYDPAAKIFRDFFYNGL